MTPHDPYIMWLRRTKTPIARCHTCDRGNTTTPFSAAAQHLREEG